MDSLPTNIDSKFRLVLLASRRAEQLIKGGRVKIKTRFAKSTRIALEEAMTDRVNWQMGPENGTFRLDDPLEGPPPAEI